MGGSGRRRVSRFEVGARLCVFLSAVYDCLMSARIKYPVIDGKKECGVCHEFKSVSEYRPVRKHYETRCKGCLKVSNAERRAKPEYKATFNKWLKKHNENPEVRDKTNKRLRVWSKLPHVRGSIRDRQRARAAQVKQQCVDYLGGKCIVCGYSRCNAALDFHHRNPAEKDKFRDNWSFEHNKPELDKCVLVCARCHREIHAGLVTI